MHAGCSTHIIFLAFVQVQRTNYGAGVGAVVVSHVVTTMGSDSLGFFGPGSQHTASNNFTYITYPQPQGTKVTVYVSSVVDPIFLTCMYLTPYAIPAGPCKLDLRASYLNYILCSWQSGRMNPT